MQANSYWNVPLLNVPHQRCTDRREHGRYLTRNFKMRHLDFTSIEQMNNPNIDLNIARKYNWQEANEAWSYNVGDVTGRYSEENDYNIEMICKLLQRQTASLVDIEKFAGNPINYQYFMSIFKEVVEDRIEDTTGILIRLIKYTDGEARELMKPCVQQPTHLGYQNAKMLQEKRYGDPHRVYTSYRKKIKNWPLIKYRDVKSYRDFLAFLNKCNSLGTATK